MAKRLNYQIGVTADTSQFKADINEAIAMLNRLGTSNQFSQNLQSASRAALELGTNLQVALNQDTGKLDLITFNNNLKKSGQSLTDYYNQLLELGSDGEQAFLQVARSVTQSELPLRRTSKLMSELWITMKNTLRWQLTSSMLHGFVGSLETAYGYSKSLNTSLNNIRIVTSKSSEEMQKFAKQANNAAKALKTTTVDYTDASLIYYQQGLNDQQVQARTETTIKLANVSRQTAEEVSSQMTAIWNNFYDGSKSLEYYADVITALGAATASSSEEIASGLQKFAPVANVVGVSYEYATTALATLVAQTRQSEESVGTSLRTLFSRIQGLKLGETLEDGTDLNKYSQALATVGVDIKDSNGELRRMDDILDDIGSKWNTLAKDQQMALAQTVGGVRQYTAFISLMDNWGKFQENLQIAIGSEGALQKQADIYAESWEAARKKVKASAEDIYDSVINEDFFIGFDNNTSIVLDRIADIIDGIGGMNGLLATGSTLILSVFGDKIADSTRRIAENIGLAVGLEQARARDLQSIANSLLQELTIEGETNEVLASRKAMWSDEVRYNIELNEIKDRLTESERQYAGEIERGVRGLKEQYELASKTAQSSQERVNQLTSNAYDRGMYGERGMRSPQEIIQSFGTQWTDRTTYRTDGEKFAGAYAQQLSNLIDRYRESNTHLARLQALQNAYRESTDKSSQALSRLATEQGFTNDELQEFIGAAGGQGINALNKMSAAARQTSIETNNLGQIIGEVVGLTEKEWQELGEAQRKYIADLIRARVTEQQYREGLTGTLRLISEIRHGYQDWANKVVSVGQTISRVAMLGNGLKSIVNIFTDESLTGIERYTRLLSSIGMLLPTIISLTSALVAVDEQSAIVTTLKTTAQTGSNTVSGVGTVVTKLYARAVDDLNDSQIRANASSIAGTVALQAKLLTMLKVVAIAALVAGAIYLLVKAYNKDADAAKRTNEQAEKLTETYEKLNSSYNNLKTSIENYQKAYEGLSYLTKGTDKFTESLEKANENAVNLIKNNKELAASAYRDEQGAIAFKDNALEEYQRKMQQRVATAQIASLAASQEANRAQLRSDTTNLQRKISYQDLSEDAEIPISGPELQKVLDIVKNNNNTFIEQNLDQLSFINEDLRASLIEHGDELERLAQSMDTVAEANKFLAQEITKSFLDIYGGEAYNNSDSATQNAINSIISAQDISSVYAGEDFRDEYAKLMGYKVGQYTDVKSLSTSYFDAETGEKIADISNEVAKEIVGRDQALKKIIDNGAIENYIKQLALLKDIGKDIGIKDLDKELLGFIQKTDTAFSNLNNLSYEEYERLKDELPNLLSQVEEQIDWKTMGYSDGEEYLKAVEDALNKWDANAYFTNLANKYANITNSALDALDVISSGKLLKDTGATKLKETFNSLQEQLGAEAAEIYNFDILGDLSSQSLFDQAASITEILADVANPEKLEKVQQEAQKTFDIVKKEYQEELEDLQEQRNDILTGEVPGSLFNIDEEIESLQDKINSLEFDPIKIDIDYEDVQIKGLLTQLDAISQAADLIDENYQVSADNIEKLIKTMPELLDDAVVNTTTGVLQLNKDTVASVTSMADEMRLENGELLSDILEQRVINAQEQLNVAQILNKEIEGLNGQQLINAIKNSSTEEEERKRVAKEIVKAKIQQAIDETQQSAQTLSNVSNDNEEMATVADHYAGETAKSWTQAASDTYTAFYKAFSKATENQEQFALGQEIHDFNDDFTKFRSVTASHFDGPEHYDYKIKREQVENPYAALLRYINGESAFEDARILGMDTKADAEILAKQLFQVTGVSIPIQKIQDGTWYDSFLAGGGDAAKASQLISEYISDQVYDLGETFGDYSKFLNDKNAINNAGKGDSKSTLSEKDRPEDFTEHFHEVNSLLEYQEKLLKEIDTEIDRTYGPDRITLYQKKLEALNRQQELLQQKLDEANSGRRMEADKLRSTIAEAQIDETSGALLNYTPLMLQITAEKQAVYDAYNEIALAGTKMSEAEKTNWDHRIKMADDAYDVKKKAIENYENAVKQANDAQEAFNENLREVEDIKLDEIAHKLEVATDAKELRDNLRDWRKSLTESTSDALYQGFNLGSLAIAQYNDDAAMLEPYIKNYNELAYAFQNATNEVDKNRIREEMVSLQEQIISTGEDTLSFIDTMENLLPDAISAAADRFALFTDQLDCNVSVLGAIKDLLSLQGVTYKTAAGFKTLNDVLESQMEAQSINANLNKQQYDNWRQQLQEAETALARTKEGDVDYDMAKANRDAILEQYNQSLEAMLQSAQDVMNTAKEIFTTAVEEASYQFEKSMSDGLSFDLMQDQFDHFIDKEERYFDEVNALYQNTMWKNKLQQDIDITTNKIYIDRLKTLQDEIDLRQKSNDLAYKDGKLSQYDLDVLEAKYNLLQAEMALEDAQNAKNTLRLVRDRQGNWNYQYTADQDAIDKAQNEVAKAQNDWYNISKKQSKAMTSEILKTYQDFNQAVKDVYNDQVLSDEAKAQKLIEIENYYTEKIKYLEAEKNIAVKDMTEAGRLTIEEFSNDYAENLDNLDGETEKFKEYSEKYMDKCEEAFNQYSQTVQTESENIDMALGDQGLKQVLEDITTSNDNLKESGTKAIDAIHGKIDEIKEITKTFQDMAGAIQNALNSYSEYAQHSTSMGLATSGEYEENENIDYSALMAYAWKWNGYNAHGYNILSEQRDNKIKDMEGDLPEGWITTQELLNTFGWYGRRDKEEGDKLANSLISGYAQQNGLTFDEALRVLSEQYGRIVGFSAGGYTGEFTDGKLAFLHQKELVLNQEDTENMLAAVQIVRTIGPELIKNIELALDQYVASGIGSLSNRISSVPGISPINGSLEQDIHVEAVFPNVTDHNEIKEAFNTIVNDAAQWARRRKE